MYSAQFTNLCHQKRMNSDNCNRQPLLQAVIFDYMTRSAGLWYCPRVSRINKPWLFVGDPSSAWPSRAGESSGIRLSVPGQTYGYACPCNTSFITETTKAFHLAFLNHLRGVKAPALPPSRHHHPPSHCLSLGLGQSDPAAGLTTRPTWSSSSPCPSSLVSSFDHSLYLLFFIIFIFIISSCAREGITCFLVIQNKKHNIRTQKYIYVNL